MTNIYHVEVDELTVITKKKLVKVAGSDITVAKKLAIEGKGRDLEVINECQYSEVVKVQNPEFQYKFNNGN